MFNALFTELSPSCYYCLFAFTSIIILYINQLVAQQYTFFICCRYIIIMYIWVYMQFHCLFPEMLVAFTYLIPNG